MSSKGITLKTESFSLYLYNPSDVETLHESIILFVVSREDVHGDEVVALGGGFAEDDVVGEGADGVVQLFVRALGDESGDGAFLEG